MTEEECSFNLHESVGSPSSRSSRTRYRSALINFGDQKERILASTFLGKYPSGFHSLFYLFLPQYIDPSYHI